MKPVVPPKTANPFHGMFQELKDVDGDDIKKCLSSIRFVFKGTKMILEDYMPDSPYRSELMSGYCKNCSKG